MRSADSEMLQNMHSAWESVQPPKPKNRKERRAEKSRARKKNLRKTDLNR